ncbi:hypothetical protein M405DRAFT_865390 [Rhizopogon salebrosus TDB-379]|nr:hypothetical protein M405DRAFT_865390 [Rhizopogon salebrosus TDB-379]
MESRQYHVQRDFSAGLREDPTDQCHSLSDLRIIGKATGAAEIQEGVSKLSRISRSQAVPVVYEHLGIQSHDL